MAKKKNTKKGSKPTSESAVRSSSEQKPSRRQLDKLDREILALVNQRAELTVQRTPHEKAPHGGPLVEDSQALEAVVKNSPGPLAEDSVRAIFRELLSGCHGISSRHRIAYLGPEYTYSHLAAIEQFGQTATLVPVGTIASVFEEVERGHADFGLIPIENSTDGRVVDALECLAKSSVKICGEVPLRIRHCLLGVGTRSDIRRVLSKPQAISQCRNWLGKHLPNAVLTAVASTADAARQASKDAKTAAIASQQAGVNHSLSVLARNIEDDPNNMTRFAVIGAESGPRTGNDKTALVYEVDHQPGALADSMGIFKRQRLNMTWIESFPVTGQPGRYQFFIEFEGHADELRPRRALAALGKKTLRLTVLGSYARAKPIG
ncbi:MAG: prephenate dehydratase [Planctomycetes bacterium]|nr:prephenate dehydratase [Planctomycetota bacterium]